MEAFRKLGVVPDMVDEVPTQKLTIKYGSLEIQPGDVVTPTQVKDMPKLSWEADDGAFYTLIMNDPDAPSREDPKFAEWHHWMVGNIAGTDLAQADSLSWYVGAGPPVDTGLHRYVFLLFKQEGKQEFEGLQRLTNRSADHRNNWSLRDVTKKYKLGTAVAGNFFLAEYDSYCDELYKQLGL